jgi:hypothetical protein
MYPRHNGAQMNLRQKYTVSEATELLGFRSRSTINKRTTGKVEPSISYEMDDAGNKVISIIELERVFPDKFKAALKRIKDTGGTQYPEDIKTHTDTALEERDTPPKMQKIRELEIRLEAEQKEKAIYQHQLQEKDTTIEDYRARLTRAEETIHRQTLLLEHRTAQNDAVLAGGIGFHVPRRLLWLGIGVVLVLAILLVLTRQ